MAAPVFPAICANSSSHAALTLGAGGGAPAGNTAAGASGQAVVRGEWQSTDVAAELNRGL